MRIVLFCHSLLSDWNHGNAHFLRGIVGELQDRGHDVRVFEPKSAWSVANLLADAGPAAITGFHRAYPRLVSERFRRSRLDLDAALDGADLVLVHEWSDRSLVKRIGRHRSQNPGYVLLFHDTHHRSVSDVEAMAAYDLTHYDGVLAFGEVIRQRYLAKGWAQRAWTWHEAADTRVFRPLDRDGHSGDLVWIGNWGDGERALELHDYLIEPAGELHLRTSVYGVRYPAEARSALLEAGIDYRGWLPNYLVPDVFARYRATVHVPRQPYVRALRGIPTIRVFEALACGIPLISAWWDDCERLFTPGEDYLVVRSRAEMTTALREVLNDCAFASAMAARGRATILARHTCAHRVTELLNIVESLRGPAIERARTA
jgi:spore maturation protein CgeB